MKLVEYIVDDEEQNEVYAISMIDQTAIAINNKQSHNEEK